ncbi:DnaJ domain-containing protein [Polaromonas sp.]|uniref:DnaJ domain-containing protein n=1 Tax=Polaromonas sp. TaxID=1869339 RepID=UPI003BA9E212
MKSAYLLLGVPGNASKEDIEEAFNKAQNHYSKSRLAGDAQAVEKFLDVKNAYNVLRDDESRAAHDRKLSSAHTPAATAPVRITRTAGTAEPQTPWFLRPLPVLATVVVLVFAIGFYINQKHVAASKAQAEQELQTKKMAEEALKQEEARLAREEIEKSRMARQAEQQDRQFRQESDRAFANARSAEAQRGYQEMQRQQAERNDAQRKEYETRAREQNLAREAQQRLASDKARIRELCYINYRRYDC